MSEEAGRAGTNAAKYVKGELAQSGKEVQIIATEGARYTVPRHIDINKMEDLLTVRFRVGAVFKNSFISVYYNDERVMHRKKQVMAPGEMEEIVLQKKKLAEYPNLESITVKIEKE